MIRRLYTIFIVLLMIIMASAVIAPAQSPVSRTPTAITSSENNGIKILGIDSTAFPKIKANLIIDKFCAMSGNLKKEDFKVKENDNDAAIDNIYFSGNASGQKLDLAIVFDETTSMNEEINALKSKVKDLTQKINSSKLDARYSLVTFNGADVKTKINWTSNADSFRNIIGKLSTSGGNIDLPENSLDGIEGALSYGFRPDAQKVIIVVTDEPSLQKGDEKSNSAYTVDDVKSDLLNSSVMLIAVYPDFRKSNVDPNVPRSNLPKYADMRVLANETGSLWIDMNSADFSTILKQIQEILTGIYVIEYTSPDQTPSDNRPVFITVNAPGCLNGSASGFYTTPGSAPESRGALSISGRVFDDSNGDGVKGTDEAGLEGWDVLLDNPDGNSVTMETDRKGYYIFTGLLPGNYSVTATAQENWTATAPETGVQVELVDLHESEMDFGFKSHLANQSPEITGIAIKLELMKVLGTPSSRKLSVAFSPDGRTLASGAENGTMTLWDVKSGAEIRTQEVRNSVNDMAFSTDVNILAASWGRNVTLYDVENRSVIRTLEVYQTANDPTFSPDGQILAVGNTNLPPWSNEAEVVLWDVKSGAEIQRLQPGYGRSVDAITFSPDGRILASVIYQSRYDGRQLIPSTTVTLWDVESGSLIRILNTSDKPMAFSPDGHTLMMAGYGGLTLWDVENDTEIRTMSGHNDGVNDVAFSPDGSTLASASNDGTIKLWEVKNGEKIRTLEGHDGEVNSVAFGPDGRTLASASNDGTLKLWDADSGSVIRTMSKKFGIVNSITFSPDDRILASGTSIGTVTLWDVESGEEIQTLFNNNGVYLYNVALSPDSRTLASGGIRWENGSNGWVTLWDVESGAEIRNLPGQYTYWGISLAFSPNGQTLALGADETVEIWNVESGEKIRTLEGHDGIVNSVAFGPDGRTLASGSIDGTARLWDVERGAEIRNLSFGKVLQGPSFMVEKLNSVTAILSKDGRILASKDSNGTVKLWDVENGTEIQTLEGHDGGVYFMTFNTKGKILASSGLSDGDTIKLWNALNGSLIWTQEDLYIRDFYVRSMAFSPDDLTLASGNMDGTIRLWRVA